jgi:hypothetical protein
VTVTGEKMVNRTADYPSVNDFMLACMVRGKRENRDERVSASFFPGVAVNIETHWGGEPNCSRWQLAKYNLRAKPQILVVFEKRGDSVRGRILHESQLECD